MVSELFDEDRWEPVTDEFEDITYHRGTDVGAVRIAFDRPEVRNAFRPETVDELYTALDHAKRQTDVGCILLTGNGPSPKDGGWAVAGQEDTADVGLSLRVVEGGVQLVDRLRPERVAHRRSVECDAYRAGVCRQVVGDIREVKAVGIFEILDQPVEGHS